MLRFEIVPQKHWSSIKTVSSQKRQKSSASAETIQALQEQLVQCELCPRLVEWRTRIATEKVRRFAHQEYWGKPVPSLGNADAKLLIVGLAPAAHGGNRTSRIFTGDRSGDWLYAALYRAGFANQPTSVHRDDGLKLIDSYITAIIHCAPPANKPLPVEISNCRSFLLRELDLLKRVRVIMALGKVAFDGVINNVGLADSHGGSKRPQFTHGVECELQGGRTLIASFHPSQRNTFTGKLTQSMFDAVFSRARELVDQDTEERMHTGDRIQNTVA